MTATDVNDFLLAGGVPAAKFDNLNDIVKGNVVDSAVSQQTDFATKKPKFYDDGNPMMQAVITLQTDERDPSVEDDDGRRKVYVKGQMTQALRDALRASGPNTKLEIGGVLAVQFIESEPSGKGNPKKIYRAQYRPPAPGTDAANDLLGSGTPAPAAAPASQPAPDDLI